MGGIPVGMTTHKHRIVMHQHANFKPLTIVHRGSLVSDSSKYEPAPFLHLEGNGLWDYAFQNGALIHCIGYYFHRVYFQWGMNKVVFKFDLRVLDCSDTDPALLGSSHQHATSHQDSKWHQFSTSTFEILNIHILNLPNRFVPMLQNCDSAEQNSNPAAMLSS